MSNFIELKGLPVYTNLLDEMSHMKLNGDQFCLTSPKGYENNIFYGIGSLKYDWKNAITKEDGSIDVPLRKVPLKETDFTELCNPFKNTSFEVIYKELKKKYILGRVRLFISHPNSCLSWHSDSEERIHYPIKTQEGCFMIIEDEVKHLEQNKWYYTKTMKKHTAFNGSKETRIHLVANVLGLQ